MRPVILTNNANLCSTARILQAWLLDGRNSGVEASVVVQKDGDLTYWLRENNVPNFQDPMPWPQRRLPWVSLWHAAQVARWARQQDVNIIHANEHDVYPFVNVLRHFLPRPAVCHVRFQIARGFAEWAFRGRRQPDALLWTSYQQQADCRDAVEGIVEPERQHVVRLGVNLEQFGTLTAARDVTRQQLAIKPHEVVIGMASPLRPRKRIEDFIELVGRMASRHASVVGLLAGSEIAGDEEYARQMQERIRNSGLGRRLRWLGNLEPVEPFYHACDVVVSTSEYETFGNSVCEAMACRRPVVGYRGGSVHEVVGDTGLIVETRDLDALVRACFRLVDSADLRRSLGQTARERVANEFNPTASLRQLGQIYQSIVARQQPGLTSNRRRVAGCESA